MKILNAFNMAQTGYSVTKAMRVRGLNADLMVTSKERFDVDRLGWEDGVEIPSWVKVVKLFSGGRLASQPELVVKLIVLFKQYDVVFTYGLGSLYGLVSGCAYVPCDAGLIRYLPFSANRLAPYRQRFYHSVVFEVLKKSYRHAKAILFMNPDTLPLFESAGLNVKFVPFTVSLDKYKPQLRKGLFDKYDLVFFMPSRLDWKEKGSDKVLRAFAMFLHVCPNSLLILVDWGVDANRTKSLVRQLGLENNARFLKPMPKRELINLYSEVDVVVDQFMVGSWGLAAAEAMACEKPVITYYETDLTRKCFGSLPPMLNAWSVASILSSMIHCEDVEARESIGRASREWAGKHHGSGLVVDTYVKTAMEVLA
jgi:glycosyltransferase involved in cell wall biosynthesis